MSIAIPSRHASFHSFLLVVERRSAVMLVYTRRRDTSTRESCPRHQCALRLLDFIVRLYNVRWKQLRFSVRALERDGQQQEPTFRVTERVGGRFVGVGRALAVHLEAGNTVSIDAVEVVAGVPTGTLGLDARVKWVNLALSDCPLDA